MAEYPAQTWYKQDSVFLLYQDAVAICWICIMFCHWPCLFSDQYKYTKEDTGMNKRRKLAEHKSSFSSRVHDSLPPFDHKSRGSDGSENEKTASREQKVQLNSSLNRTEPKIGQMICDRIDNGLHSLPNGSSSPNEVSLVFNPSSVLKHRHTTTSSQTTSQPLLCAHCSKFLSSDASYFRLFGEKTTLSSKADIVLVNSPGHISHEDTLYRDRFEETLINECGLTVQQIKSSEKDYVYTVISGSWEGLVKAAEHSSVSMALNRKFVKKFPKRIQFHRVCKSLFFMTTGFSQICMLRILVCLIQCDIYHFSYMFFC